MIDRRVRDQTGFAPTLPTGYSWGRRGVRLVVPDEAPKAGGSTSSAPSPHDPAGACFLFATRRKAEGRYDVAAHLGFVERLAAAGTPGHPCVIGMDTYSVHHRQVVKEAISDWRSG